MNNNQFESRLIKIKARYEELINRPNPKMETYNGIYFRYMNPIVTTDHIPYFWKYDLNTSRNPNLMERFGFNATFNAGAIKFKDKYILLVRVEGVDRKSFFAIAESPNGVDHFTFWDYPVNLTSTRKDVNIYDMRLVLHEDGWIYGIFCTECHDESVGYSDQSAAIAQCGIARTKDLIHWDRLEDLKTPSPQQRNVVLHPEFVGGKYGFYTRPQDGFINTGSGVGIGFGTVEDISHAVINNEVIVDKKDYHTISEAKNGLGPAPIKTSEGWLHLAHGVRNTAAGMRYTLYVFMTDLEDLTKIIYKPAGYLLAPKGNEYVGDVSNVLFSNGWILDDDGRILIYYASSDSRMHVAETSLDKLLDYVKNTSPDSLYSAGQLEILNKIIENNLNAGLGI